MISNGISYQIGTETEECCFIENRVLSGSGFDVLILRKAEMCLPILFQRITNVGWMKIEGSTITKQL
jgi:hypothetical protein